MLEIFKTSHKDDTDAQKTLEATAEALADSPEEPAEHPAVLFTDKTPEEREKETLDLQAKYRNLRENTSELLKEEHPEVTRLDTVEEAHKRGEI